MDLAVAAIAAVAIVALVVMSLGLVVVFAPVLRTVLAGAAGAVLEVACDLFGSGFFPGTGTRSRRREPRPRRHRG
jgi:hypothetical protein